MSSHIDFRTLPASIPSLCIPRVYPNIDERRIRQTFDDLNLGIIERVDIVRKTTEKGEKCNRVFIHFSRWFSSKNADTARERLLNGQDIKVIYDDPWFWKVAAYREASEPRREPERSYERREPERRPPRPSGGRMVTYAESRREPPTKEQVDRELDRINIANGNLLAVEQPSSEKLSLKPVEVMPPPPRQAPRQKNFIDFNDHRPGLDTNPIAVNYDMTAINGTKKRAITIKKAEPKPKQAEPVKVGEGADDKEKSW